MDPELEALLQLMQCGTPQEARAQIAATNAALSDFRAATGATNMAETRTAVQATFAAVRELEKLTNKSGAEAIATATAWRQGAIEAATAQTALQSILPPDAVKALGDSPSLAVLVGAVSAGHKARDKAEAFAKIDVACTGRTIPAARAGLETIYNDFGAKALDAAIAVLPPVAQGAPSQDPAPVPTAVNSAVMTDADRRVAKAMGVSESDFLKGKQQFNSAAKDNPREVSATA